MIRLDATTRKLQIVLAGAVAATQPDIVVSYYDKTATAITGGTQCSVGNNTTAVDICAAPAASTMRDVDLINIKNNDSAAVTATVRFNDNATLYKLITIILAVGDTLEYTHAGGWDILNTNSVIGPATATDGHITVFDGTTGKLVKDSGTPLGCPSA